MIAADLQLCVVECHIAQIASFANTNKASARSYIFIPALTS